MSSNPIEVSVKIQRNEDGTFKKGTHWRNRKPFWEKQWLENEYVAKGRSSGDIAKDFGLTVTAILFWIRKHGIKTRSISEARKLKKWGLDGEKNGMYGMTGSLNPHWKGGITPMRQAMYSRSQWKTLARKVRCRDGGKCRKCGSGGKTHIHHIETVADAPLFITELSNMILLCEKCHWKIKGKEKRWRKKLAKLIDG